MSLTSVVLPCPACERTGIARVYSLSCFVCDGLGYEEHLWETKQRKKRCEQPVMKTNLLENANEISKNAERH